jgi:hypothetical protein
LETNSPAREALLSSPKKATVSERFGVHSFLVVRMQNEGADLPQDIEQAIQV